MKSRRKVATIMVSSGPEFSTGSPVVTMEGHVMADSGILAILLEGFLWGYRWDGLRWDFIFYLQQI